MSLLDNAYPFFNKNVIFMNNVNSYNGKHIASYLSTLAYKSAIALQSVEEYGEDGPPSESVKEEETKTQENPESPQVEDFLQILYFEVIGTVSDKSVKEVSGVKTIVPPDSISSSVIQCGVIVLDISQSLEDLEVVEQLLDYLDEYLSSKSEEITIYLGESSIKPKPIIRRVILVSSVMTWALTKSSNPELNDDEKLTENLYDQRVPTDSYKQHYKIEEKLLDLGRRFKEMLQVIVITSGITYGFEESLFYTFFQMAWEGERLIPIFGNGQNNLPLIHVKDLSIIIGFVLQSFPSQKPFIFAIEKEEPTLQDIIFLLGKNYGSGYFQYISKEEVVFLPEITSYMYFHLTFSVPMEANFIHETEELRWTHTCSLIEDMNFVYEEFTTIYKLKPHKIIIFGPPAAGKTKLAMGLSLYYGITFYSEEILNTLIIDDLKWKIYFYSNLKSDERMNGPESIFKDNKKRFISLNDENIDDLRIELHNLQTQRILPKEALIKYLQQKLASNESRAKGWILEGFPKEYLDCVQLFGKSEDEDQIDEIDGEEEEAVGKDPRLPDFVVSLEAPDLFLCERVMLQREKNIYNLPYNERDMLKNLKDFRKMVSEDNTLLTFFEDVHVEIRTYDLTLKEMSIENILDMLFGEIGDPSSLTKEEIESPSDIELRLRLAEDQRMDELKKSIEKENEVKMKQWTNLYKLLKKEEAERIRIHSNSLRQYLMAEVFPILTNGLAMVVKVRPDDPIDFLAEYLFRENASGQLFEPGYNFCADHLMILFDEINKYMTVKKPEKKLA